jgi:hypothetical protein
MRIQHDFFRNILNNMLDHNEPAFQIKSIQFLSEQEHGNPNELYFHLALLIDENYLECLEPKINGEETYYEQSNRISLTTMGSKTSDIDYVSSKKEIDIYHGIACDTVFRLTFKGHEYAEKLGCYEKNKKKLSWSV